MEAIKEQFYIRCALTSRHFILVYRMERLTIPDAVTSLLALDRVLATATFIQFNILPYSFPV